MLEQLVIHEGALNNYGFFAQNYDGENEFMFFNIH